MKKIKKILKRVWNFSAISLAPGWLWVLLILLAILFNRDVTMGLGLLGILGFSLAAFIMLLMGKKERSKKMTKATIVLLVVILIVAYM